MIDRISASEVFLASVELGSISAAAERLDMSRAMASRYVAAVETWAGVRLLHRSTRHLSLTGPGEQLLPTLKTLVALSDRVAWPGIAQSDEPCGPLRVSLSVIAAQSLMGEAFASFMARYPRVQLELLATNERVNLIEERIDLAIRITNELDPQLICRPLGQCHSVLCAAPGYLAVHGRPTHPEQLAQHQCLTYTHFGPGQWTLHRDDEVCQVAVSGGAQDQRSYLADGSPALAGWHRHAAPIRRCAPVGQRGARGRAAGVGAQATGDACALQHSPTHAAGIARADRSSGRRLGRICGNGAVSHRLGC